MKKSKIYIGAVTVLCVVSFAGCAANGVTADDKSSIASVSSDSYPIIEGNDSVTGNLPKDNDTDNTPFSDSDDTNNTSFNEDNDQNDASLISNATVLGSVVAFSDDYCTIAPVETSGDSNEAVIAAAGSEDADKNVTIHYQNGCTFQIAEIYVATGTKIFSDAEVSDIKKQTSLIIYGEWTDTHNINATKVYIARYMQ